MKGKNNTKRALTRQQQKEKEFIFQAADLSLCFMWGSCRTAEQALELVAPTRELVFTPSLVFVSHLPYSPNPPPFCHGLFLVYAAQGLRS